MSTNFNPIVEFHGVCWYYEGPAGEREKVRHEGRIEVHPNWAYLGSGHCVPRERVEQVMR